MLFHSVFFVFALQLGLTKHGVQGLITCDLSNFVGQEFDDIADVNNNIYTLTVGSGMIRQNLISTGSYDHTEGSTVIYTGGSWCSSINGLRSSVLHIEENFELSEPIMEVEERSTCYYEFTLEVPSCLDDAPAVLSAPVVRSAAQPSPIHVVSGEAEGRCVGYDHHGDLYLNDCTDGPEQVFELDENGRLVVQGGNFEDHCLLADDWFWPKLRTCDNTNEQKWQYVGGKIATDNGEKCLMYDPDWTVSMRLKIEDCEDDDNFFRIFSYGGTPAQPAVNDVANTNDVAVANNNAVLSSHPEISPGVVGDPHFKTWAGILYDFHGVCDLVLLKNDEFENGIGMNIHLRTTKMRIWSYVSVAALRIGEDILEVKGGTEENKFWINGVKGDAHISNIERKFRSTLVTTLSNYPVYFYEVSKRERKFVIELDEEENIVMSTWNFFVRVQFHKVKSTHFESSSGLMGSFAGGVKLARDNKTILTDSDTFGQEWQVLRSEPKLFHATVAPQHPLECEIPTKMEMRRRLQHSEITAQDAQKACENVNAGVINLCVFDLIVTQDMSMADAYQ